MKINRIELHNLQSWRGEEVIDLSPFGLTVLKGPSETGKSTLTRFLMKFCGKEMDSQELFFSYVRRGCKEGTLCLRDLESKEKLSLTVNQNGRFLIFEQEGSDVVEFYTEDEINETLLEKFGIVVDDVNNIAINVFGRDNPSLGVATSALLNGSVLDRVLVGRELERVLDNLKNQETETKEFLKTHEIKRHFYRTRMSSLTYIDEDTIKYNLIKVQELESLCKFLSDVERNIQIIKDTHLPEVTSAPPVTEASLRTMLQFVSFIDRIGQEISNMPAVHGDKDAIFSTKMNLMSLQQIINSLDSVMKLLVEYNNIKTPTAPACSKSLPELQQLLTLADMLSLISIEIDKITEQDRKHAIALRNLELAKDKLKQLKEELRVCPLCGSEFGG